MNISLIVDDSAARALLSRAPEQVRVAQRGALQDAASYLMAKLRAYPPPPPNSTYTRTRTLARSWFPTVTGEDATLRSSGNIAPYNRAVMDRDRQARVHRGRWITVQTQAEHAQPTIQRFFEDRLRAVGL